MTSKLAQMQARFQQKQIQEREEKLLKLYESQQQKTIERIGRSSAGSNTSIGSTGGGGKVRQMFDERRSKAGIDKSYPLEPLKTKPTSKVPSSDKKTTTNTRTTVRSTVANSVSSLRNGKPVLNKREVVHSIYSNNNGNESYEEHRYEDDNFNIKSNSQNDMIEMLNNHNLNDTLDNEELPKIGFDEVDDEMVHQKSPNNNVGLRKLSNVNGTKRIEQKPPIRSTAPSPKQNGTVLKKTSRPPATTPTKTSPRTATPPSPARTPSSAGSSASTMNSKSSKNTGQRTPTASRPSAKQQHPKTSSAAVTRDDLAECNYCGRRFAADRIQKHEDVCSKTGKKKRKAYDATKHRVAGTELESYVMKSAKSKVGASAKSKQANKKDWRKTHEEFIAAIRAAKEAQAHLAKGGKLADLPPPPPSSNPDYVQCPHCGRRFNESAAERHIPKCANYQFNKPKAGPATSSKGKTSRK